MPIGYKPKCGQHRATGLDIRALNPSDQSDKFSSTHFGEWPHVCILFDSSKKTSNNPGRFIGGASLISPGIVFTAAHKLE